MKKQLTIGSILFFICTLALAQTVVPPAPYIKAANIKAPWKNQPPSEKTWLWEP